MPKKRSIRDRRKAERKGRWAEWLCCFSLWLRGYRILGTRLRLPGGEIDILAVKGKALAVIEVKARPSLEAALAAVSLPNWRRRHAAANQYLTSRPHLHSLGIRFDLMVVRRRRWPKHIKDVWRAEG